MPLSDASPTPQPIRGEKILLQQLLKILHLVTTGGETKEFLYNERVEVNGEAEARRSRQLFDGDVVTLPDGRRVVIVAETPRTTEA